MASFIMTGAPGAGKTTVLEDLARRGFAVVPEAATDVIADAQRAGVAKPWEHADFIETIMALQIARMAGAPDRAVHDRSVICTLALCRFLGREVPVDLLEACTVARQHFAPSAFFVRLLGFITPSAARQIGYDEALRFESFHEAVYREYGFELIEIPAGPVADRADFVTKAIASRTK